MVLPTPPRAWMTIAFAPCSTNPSRSAIAPALPTKLGSGGIGAITLIPDAFEVSPSRPDSAIDCHSSPKNSQISMKFSRSMALPLRNLRIVSVDLPNSVANACWLGKPLRW
ncbi:MAG: hypothetical protein KME16_18395 [Scytolyngbya sp. HA4215-MV1]|nr:hypothetical protein [Scytolyngbya sp. HA4215-MV1]